MKRHGIIDLVPGKNPDDLMLIKVLYHRGTPESKWIDALDIVYKEISTGKKSVRTIEGPEVNVFMPKEGYERSVPAEHMSLDEVNMFWVPYRDREMAIAKLISPDHAAFVADARRSNNRNSAKNIHKSPLVVGSDYPIEQWAFIQWSLNMANNKEKHISKAYFDIEVDLRIGHSVRLDDMEHPINAVTLIDEDSSRSFTLLLRNKNNPQIDEFEDSIDEFTADLHESFDELYGKLEYSFFMYDNEMSLIKDYIKLVKTLNPDFLMAWNMDFDIPYIIGRCNALGIDYLSLFHNEEMSRPQVYYKKSNTFVVEERSSLFSVSDMTVYIDQQAVYGATRKGSGAIRSFKLNDIGMDVLGEGKIDYSESSNIKDLPYDNYKQFVKYNIKDVLLQMGIERQTQDIESLYFSATENSVPYHQAFKQTRFLDTCSYVHWYNQGYIIGNNTNVDYDTPYNMRFSKEKDGDKDKYDGGIVADPNLNGEYGRIVAGMRNKHVFGLSVVFDLKALYPSVYRAWNISRSTMIGKVVIDESVDDVINTAVKLINTVQDGDDVTDTVSYDSGTMFLDDLSTGNTLQFCETWLGLPDASEIEKELEAIFNE